MPHRLVHWLNCKCKDMSAKPQRSVNTAATNQKYSCQVSVFVCVSVMKRWVEGAQPALPLCPLPLSHRTAFQSGWSLSSVSLCWTVSGCFRSGSNWATNPLSPKMELSDIAWDKPAFSLFFCCCFFSLFYLIFGKLFSVFVFFQTSLLQLMST